MRFPHWKILVIPYILLAIGIFFNVLVVTCNQGYMPVAMSSIMAQGTVPGQVIDEIHRAMQHSDHLKALADWIQVPRMMVASPGDALMWLGDWLSGPMFIVWLTLLWRDANPHRD